MYLQLSLLFGFFIIFMFVAKPPKSGRKKVFETGTKTLELRFQGRLYDVTNFVKKHPGGKIIEFYLNNEEDATHAIQQFHYRSKERVALMMKSLASRPIPEENLVPAREKFNEELTKDFLLLTEQAQKEGLFEPSLSHLAIRILEIFVLGFVGFGLDWVSDSVYVTMISTLILIIFGLRTAFLSHELGHLAMTGIPRVDRALETLSDGLIMGLSASWWRSQHNRHHAMPQRIQHDVDLMTLPFGAFNAKLLKEGEKPNFFIRNQGKLFIPWLSMLGGIRWRFYLNPKYSLVNFHFDELILCALNVYIFFNFSIPRGIIGGAVGSSLVLLTFLTNHSHLPVADEPRHWVESGLIHTMNVDPWWFVNWWTGRLSYQIEHHLFPTMPHFRLHLISERVKALAKKHNLPYRSMPYSQAVLRIFENLNDVSHELVAREKDTK